MQHACEVGNVECLADIHCMKRSMCLFHNIIYTGKRMDCSDLFSAPSLPCKVVLKGRSQGLCSEAKFKHSVGWLASEKF